MSLQTITKPETAETEQQKCGCITILAKSPADALRQFHLQGLSQKGYSIAGKIMPNKFGRVTDTGEIEQLFDGETYYAATFFLKSAVRG